MLFAYNILTYIVGFHLKLIALFNKKISLGVEGRKKSFAILKEALAPEPKTVWFHCASLGEYEQGLPVFEQIKLLYPHHKIILSFFSPSGYEIKKDSSLADVVVYLPLDTRANARRFISLVSPDLVIFVKYEIWPNYLFELKRRKIRTILISALFRPSQTYFKSSGKWMLGALGTFNWIFVQNDASVELLKKHGITNASRSGDTRFDRVNAQLGRDNTIEILDSFKDGNLLMVAGSTWPEGEDILVDFINSDNSSTKFIIAPHKIKESRMEKLSRSVDKEVIRLSRIEDPDLSGYKVLILDTIGMLARAYSYADLAYVGGAMGTTGLHNTLEPAVFGIPIIIGPNYEKFPEAKDMIRAGGMFVAHDATEFRMLLEKLILEEEFRRRSGECNSNYIKKNMGAVVQIMDFIRKY